MLIYLFIYSTSYLLGILVPSPPPQVLQVHVSPADLCDNEELGDAHLIEAGGCSSCY